MINTDIGIINDIRKRLQGYLDECDNAGVSDSYRDDFYYYDVVKIVEDINDMLPEGDDDSIINDTDRLIATVSKVAVILPYLWL